MVNIFLYIDIFANLLIALWYVHAVLRTYPQGLVQGWGGVSSRALSESALAHAHTYIYIQKFNKSLYTQNLLCIQQHNLLLCNIYNPKCSLLIFGPISIFVFCPYLYQTWFNGLDSDRFCAPERIIEK